MRATDGPRPAPGRLRREAAGAIFAFCTLLVGAAVSTWTLPLTVLATLSLSATAMALAGGPERKAGAAGVALAAAVLLALDASPSCWQLWIVLAAAASRRDDGVSDAWGTALWIHALGFVLAPELVPVLGRFLDADVPAGLSALLSRVAGRRISGGATVFGLPAVFLACSYGIARLLRRDPVRRPLLTAAAAGAAALAVLATAGLSLSGKSPPPAFAPVLATAAVLGALFARNVLAGDLLREPAPGGGGRRRGWIPAVALLFAAIQLHPDALRTSKELPRIVVLNRGGLDWEASRHGEYGSFSGGMFGLLPRYLPSMEAVEPARLAATLATPPDVLVLINDPHVWTEAERREIEAYVERGGGLLVLGDHTDVFGLMRGFNSLLSPWGLEFRFDSAYPDGGHFAGGVKCGVHDLALRGRRDAMSTGIGASLDLRAPWRPVIQGRFAFSDDGIRENWMGSMLGNYAYDPGETYGDVVLVASRTLGRGRVAVFGDTSAFQNGSLSENAEELVAPVFRWLAKGRSPLEVPAGGPLGAAALLVALVATARRPGAAAAVLLAALALLEARTTRDLRRPLPSSGPEVLIDGAHAPNVGHYQARRNPIGPLYSNLIRSALLPVDFRDWDAARLARARGFVAVQPTRPLSRSELEDIDGYVRAGGTVVFAGDAEGGACWASALDRWGLKITDVPLGRLPPREWSDPLKEDPARGKGGGRARGGAESVALSPAFVCGWQVISTRSDPFESLFEVSGRQVAVARRVGRGSVVVIGDPRVFSSLNVEGEWGHHSGTLRWLAVVFDRYLGGRPEGFPEPFPKPERPKD